MSPANPRPPIRNAKPNRRFSNNVPPGLHYLPPLDPRSEEFVELFRSFLLSKDERTNILALAEQDARLFIELIDRAFRASPLDNELRQLAFSILRRLSHRIGHLPESYLLSDKFDVSEKVFASGGFADVRKGVFKGKNVAVKTLRVSLSDDYARILRRFCKDVTMWKNLSHPNVLELIGVPDTLEEGRFSVVSEWMANGNIVEYVRNNAGNHLRLLAGAIEGLSHLHKANIVHGGLKGANILITNTNPISACLADFGLMAIVHDPGLEMESSKSVVTSGTAPFMAPELLVPSRFGLEKCAPTKGADIYAMAMAIYQVLIGSLPYGKIVGSEVVFKVLGGEKPLKPANAIKLGLSDKVWRLLEDCWRADSASRPSVNDVSACVKSAASTCGILSPVGDTPQRHEDPDSDLFNFDHLFPDGDGIGAPKFSNNVPPRLHRLLPLDPRSEEFVELFRSLLSSKDERRNILALVEPDARLFIELIDRAFQAAGLDPELRQLAFNVLRRLCGRVGHLPESYLLSDKFDVPDEFIASGSFADVRMGAFKGKSVAVKTLRVSLTDDKAKIRTHFCKEVAMWKNLSHPNVLDLIGVPDTLEEGRFSMVSGWMANGNIVEYVRNNAGNHLQLLAGAVEGLSFLHNANIVHGGLKGANILITNTNPVSACLADFGFMTIVHDPGLEMESSKSVVAGGTTHFTAPELLVPSILGLEKCAPTMGADIYAMAMTIYQVLTGSLPYGNLGGFEVILKVLVGQKPPKPGNAIELGLSDEVWRLLEDCWKTDSASRPSVKDVSVCVKSAASTCGTLYPIRDIPHQHSGLSRFSHLFSDGDGLGAAPMGRSPSEDSTLTDTLLPDPPSSPNVSEASSLATEPPQIRIDGRVAELKEGGAYTTPDVTSGPTVDNTPHPQTTTGQISRPPMSFSASKVQLWSSHDNPSPYVDKIFAHSNSNSRGAIVGVASTQREDPRSGTVLPRAGETYPENASKVDDSVASPFVFLPGVKAIGETQAWDDPTHQSPKLPRKFGLPSPKSQPADACVSDLVATGVIISNITNK